MSTILDSLDFDGVHDLANAIVVQACRDYLNTHTQVSKDSIEDFLRSDWFEVLTDGKVDGEYIINQLRAVYNGRRKNRLYFRVKEKAEGGTRTKELGWYLSQSEKRKRSSESLYVGCD